MLHELTTDTRRWRTFHFVPKGKGCGLPLETDLEFSLGVREMSLRAVDSKLGSDWEAGGHLGAAWAASGLSDCTERREGVVWLWSVSRWKSSNLGLKEMMDNYWSKCIFKVNSSGMVWP